MKYIAFIIGLICPISLTAQWGNAYSSGFDTSIWDSFVARDSSIVSAGWVVRNGDREMFIHKINTSGVVVWSQTFASSEPEHIRALAEDPSNAQIMVVGVKKDPANNEHHLVLLKLDTNGTLLWQYEYPYPIPNVIGGSESAFKIGKLSNGNWLISVSRYENGGAPDAMLWQVDANGNVIWVKQLPVTIGQSDTGYGWVELPNQEILLTGFHFNGLHHPYILKFDLTTATVLWTQKWDDGFNSGGTHMQLLQNGNVLVLSGEKPDYSGSDWSESRNNIVLSEVNSANGNIIWTKRYSTIGIYSDTPASLVVHNGQAIVSGLTNKFNPGNVRQNDIIVFSVDISSKGQIVSWGNRFHLSKDEAYPLLAKDLGNLYLTGTSKSPNVFSNTFDFIVYKDYLSQWANYHFEACCSHKLELEVTSKDFNVWSETVTARDIRVVKRDLALVQQPLPLQSSTLCTFLTSADRETSGDFTNRLMEQPFQLRIENYPNPFDKQTQIVYSLEKSEEVSLNIYDISGRLVERLVQDVQEAGVYKVTFDALQLPSGTYFYQLITPTQEHTRQMILIK